jgi:hypothetical protein
MSITRISLNYKQKRTVEDYILTVLSASQLDDTLFIYDHGFDDAVVADKVDFPCAGASVKRIRLAMFGPLVLPEKAPPKKSILTEQVQALAKRVHVLEKVLAVDPRNWS